MPLFHKERKPRLRKWAKEASEWAARTANENDPKSLVLVLATFLLRSISTFFEEALPDHKDKNAKFFHRMVQKFNNDACLFEVFCYISFRLDAWISVHGYPNFREVYNGGVIKNGIDVFEHLLEKKGLDKVLESRMHAYARAVSEDNTGEKERHFVAQFIIRTESERKVRAYDIVTEPLLIAPVPTDVMIVSHLAAYMTAYFERHVKGLEAAIRSMINAGYIIDKMEWDRGN